MQHELTQDIPLIPGIRAAGIISCQLVPGASHGQMTGKSRGIMTGMGHARPRVGVNGKTRWAAVYLDLHGRERHAGT